jgi:hypothetical protein
VSWGAAIARTRPNRLRIGGPAYLGWRAGVVARGDHPWVGNSYWSDGSGGGDSGPALTGYGGACAVCGHYGEDCTGVRRLELRYVGSDSWWADRYPYFAAVEWTGHYGSIVIRYDAPNNDLDGPVYKMRRRGWKRSGVGLADAQAEVERVLAGHCQGGTAAVTDFSWEWAR